MVETLDDSPGAPAAQRQLLLGLSTLLAVFLAVFGPGVLASLRLLAGAAAPVVPNGWADRAAALEWDVFVTALVVVVVVRWLPKHAPLVTGRMGLASRFRRPFAGGLAGASAAYVAVALASSWAGNHATAMLHLARGSYPQPDGGTGGFVVSGVAAAAAGVTEEVTLVALAAAVVAAAFDILGRRSRWALPTTLAVLIALRWLVHAYYLWGSLFVLAWAPGVYLLYRWVGSVWPLIVGHCGYDWLALAQHAYPRASAQLNTTLWTLAAVGALAIAVSGVCWLAGSRCARR